MDWRDTSYDYCFLDILQSTGKLAFMIPEYLGRRYSQSVRLLVALIFTLSDLRFLSLCMRWLLPWRLSRLAYCRGRSCLGSRSSCYSISGGLSAVTFTDALQVSIMFGCAIIVAYLGLWRWENKRILKSLRGKKPHPPKSISTRQPSRLPGRA